MVRRDEVSQRHKIFRGQQSDAVVAAIGNDDEAVGVETGVDRVTELVRVGASA
jgi:hypothetical protein